MKAGLLVAAGLSLGSLLFGTVDARASASYPEALRKQLELDAIAGAGPGCQLCHKDDAGGVRTATKPFGRAVISAGATGGSIPSLLAALDTLEAQGTDSDGDGEPDIAELRSGTDPNVGMDGSVPEEVPPPEVGCGVVSRDPSSTFALLPLVALLLSRAWRSRRGSSARQYRP